VGELALIFEVAGLAGRRRLSALIEGIGQAGVPVPFVTQRLVDRPVLGHHVVLVFVMVDAVVAGRAGLRLAGLDDGELVACVAVVALGLVGMAHRAAGG